MSILRRKLRRDLRRRRAQFGAVAVTVFLGTAIFAATYDSFRNLETSYRRTFSEFRFADLTVQGGDVETFADQAGGLPGVQAVETRTVAEVPVRIGPDKLLGRLASMPAEGQPEVNRVRVLEGSYLDPSRPEAVLLEQHLAEHFGLGPGDRVEILGAGGWVTLDVRGVASSPEYIWPARSRQEILTTPDNFGVLFGSHALARRVLPGVRPNEAVVYYADGADEESLRRDLVGRADAAGAAGSFTRDEQPSNAALKEDLRGFEEFSVFFPILFLSAGGMAAYLLLTRLVQSQRPQIGVLRAEGFRRRRVLGHYLGYGLLLGLPAAALGVAAGMALAYGITGVYTRVISVPLRVIEFRPSTLVTGVGIGVLASLLAAAAPALAASRVPPAEAMRGLGPAKVARRGLLDRIAPFMRRLPVRWKIATRGPRRSPRRTLYTILGVILSLTLVLTSWGMLDTTQILLDLQFRRVQQHDAEVALATSGQGLEALRAAGGVAAVEPALRLPVSIRSGDRRYGSELLALEPGTEMHRFLLQGGGEARLGAEGLLVGAALRDLLGVEVGDGVRVAVAGSSISFEEAIAGFLEEPFGTVAYISLGRLETLVGAPVPPTSALVRYEPGADPDAVRRRLTALPEAAAVQNVKALYDLVQDFMGLFYAFVGIMLAFGGAMAFALLFASMTANVAERSREMASLLAAGARRADLGRLIAAENLLVVLAGVGPGLLAGYVVADLAMASFSSDLFRFDLHMRGSTLALSGAAVVAVALISQWPALRAMRRLDVAEVVRERSL